MNIKTDSNTLLCIDNVSKAYDTARALNGVSMEINRNEFFALLGPSGCGKTTLLRAIAGFEDPDSGSITISDETGSETDLLSLPPNKRPVNLMFQSYALFPHMNVRKNIAYGLEREKLSHSEIAARVDEVLETVGLTDKSKARPAHLSGGQRQRVALARAIVKRPRLLLLDEPLSALDRKVRAEMQLELKRLQHEVGITFVVVTHDQEEAMSMADRIAVMDSGEVQQIADPVTLYTRPNNIFVADFIGSGTLIPGVVSPAGFTTQVGALGTGSHLLPANNPSNVRGAAVIMLRPEAVHLSREHHSGSLPGLVVETHFYGGSSVSTLTVPGLDHPVITRRPGPPEHAVGEQVHLNWPAEDAIVLAAPTAQDQAN
jgi:spermidine/putrescine transport system ATP-binding protein/putrescine transport system ATP-binding protein